MQADAESTAVRGNIRAAPACGNAAGPLSSPSMLSPRLYLSVACAALLGCGADAPPPTKLPTAFAVFPNLPMPPEARLVSRAGSADALQLTLFSSGKTEAVSEYYRDQLSKGKWRLVGDAKRPDGSLALYAEREGRPLWVRIWPTSDSAGTMVELAGAVVGKGADSVKGVQPQSKPGPKPQR